jgi:hypothetical protein
MVEKEPNATELPVMGGDEESPAQAHLLRGRGPGVFNAQKEGQ